MDNEMTNYIPRTTYNGEDCFIIPLRQIVEIRYNLNFNTVVPEIELRIRGE